MRIVADHHHGVLWEAFAMLFVDRYGWELLGWADGHYHRDRGAGRWDFHADFPPRRVEIVSTAWLREHGADVLMASTGVNRAPMQWLAKELDALYVDHVGNAWDGPIGDVVLRSVAGDYGELYHPEFHRLPYQPPTGRRIGAFHGSLAVSGCRPLWDAAADTYRQYEFVLYGTTEHALYPYEVAGAMRDCLAIWHDKDADGYGFTVHEAFASGRPVIGHAGHYQGKLAEPLWVHGLTYLEPGDDLGKLDPEMGLAGLEAFRSLVDFDVEAANIRSYLQAAT